jgi:hypothetical protein
MGSRSRLAVVVRSILMICLMACLLAPCLSGCAAVGAIANAFPPAAVPPKYTGLKDQSVAVLVWVERGIRIDWPQFQLDCAMGIQNKLVKAKKDKARELTNTRFPLSAPTVVRFQDEHPDWAADSIEDIAPRLGVSRVIYVEIDGFQTRSDAAVDLYRGNLSGTVRVLEVTGGKARVVHTEEDLRTIWPAKSPEEGVPNRGDFETYRQTLDAFTTDVAHLFVSYTPDEP